MSKPLSEQFFPLLHGVQSPYGHLACDDVDFVAACQHDDRVWQEHQVNMRNMLAGVAEQVKKGREQLFGEQHGDLTCPFLQVATPQSVPLADSWWW